MKTSEKMENANAVSRPESAPADIFADDLPATPITLPPACHEEMADDDELLFYLTTPLPLPVLLRKANETAAAE
jgi:hypothetical protein